VQPDSGIEQCVSDVDEQIGDNDGRGGDEHDPDDDRQIRLSIHPEDFRTLVAVH
jgi:hypothetical protein